MPANNKRRESDPPLPTLDVEGLWQEWDQSEDIRNRLREGDTFIHPEGKTDDVPGCCVNSSVLAPLLIRMSTIEGKPLPPVDPIRLEIDKLLTKNKRGNSPEEVIDVVKSSWRLKKMCGFIKMKVRRHEVSTVTQRTISILFFRFWSLKGFYSYFPIWSVSLLFNRLFGSDIYSDVRLKLSSNCASFSIHCSRPGSIPSGFSGFWPLYYIL